MRVAELLEKRKAHWQQLESLCERFEGRKRRELPGEEIARLSSLYRAACADLALADAYQLPPGTVGYLHQLVGRAHNQLYRSTGLQFQRWLTDLLVHVPRRLFRDGYLRVAALLFWGIFLLTGLLGAQDRSFSERMIGKEMLMEHEEMFQHTITGREPEAGLFMASFYIYHNIGIGLSCFAFGMLFGVGGLFATAFNAAYLGTLFGHMATVAHRNNFYEFVTAHGPFELTAITLSAAAGLRMGFALVNTRGMTRSDAVRTAAIEAMPVMGAGMAMFFFAAIIEGLISPSGLPYAVKAGVAIASTLLLLVYFFVLGAPRVSR